MTDSIANNAFRSLPSVQEIVTDAAVQAAASGLASAYLVDIVRAAINNERASLTAQSAGANRDRIAVAVVNRLHDLMRPKLDPLINATGVILHTNLGRAPVSAAAAEAMRTAASAFVPLELEIASGARGGRMAELETLFCALTGCEAALVVNNNAAATMLVLAAVLRPDATEVIVSRAEAVEIGGSFRIPDILRESGATLVDVGTTNRTYRRDYEGAITTRTAALLKVHASNFRVTGFVHAAASAALVPVADERGIPLIDDLGSGALLDTTRYGLAAEPMLQTSIASGAHLVCASGDKLLGGPQAGIILGRREWVWRCAAHPLARAFRADKATLSGLAATLRHYLRGEHETQIPVWRMIATAPETLRARCIAWRDALISSGIDPEVLASQATIGGGSLPGETLPSFALTIRGDVARAHSTSLDALASRLRRGTPPIVPRIDLGRLWLDARTVSPDDDDIFVAALCTALPPNGSSLSATVSAE